MLRFARQKCHRVEFLRQVSVRRATSDGASPVIDVNVHSTDIYWGATSVIPDTAAEVNLAGPDFLEDIN